MTDFDRYTELVIQEMKDNPKYPTFNELMEICDRTDIAILSVGLREIMKANFLLNRLPKACAVCIEECSSEGKDMATAMILKHIEPRVTH